ncbi:MAG: hypothetical protein R2744_00095 [Bacteroidales bacterium]
MRFGDGHIHDTYRVTAHGGNYSDYILQRINHEVFRDVPALQSNIERVTSHIRAKLMAAGIDDIDRRILTLIPAAGGRSWCQDEDGNYWRLYLFIKDHRTYDFVDSPARAYQGGRAVGRFQSLLSDLPYPPLHETIPRFHDVRWRMDNFRNAVVQDPEKQGCITAG